MRLPPSSLANIGSHYFRRVKFVMEICMDLVIPTPGFAEVFFGITGKHATSNMMPNYEIRCGDHSFLFLGSNHRPFSGKTNDATAYIAGSLRSGSFHDDNVTRESRTYDEISQYAADSADQGSGDSFENTLEQFYEEITLSDTPSPPPLTIEERDRVIRDAARRDQRFFRRLLKVQKKPNHCSVCNMNLVACLQGAHMIDVQHNGADVVQNGLVLCGTHHLLFDRFYFGINPVTKIVEVAAWSKLTLDDLKIANKEIDEPVGDDALKAKWKLFKGFGKKAP